MDAPGNQKHPDVIIRCDHGHRGGDAEVIQRFRWMISQGHWVPTRQRGASATSLRGDDSTISAASIEDYLQIISSERLRTKYEVLCGIGRCPNRVPAPIDHLEDVFSILDVDNNPVRVMAPLADRFETRDVVNALITRRTRDDITLTLDSLRLALRYRNRISDTLTKRMRGGD